MHGNTARKVWLLLCSYVFYAAWNWKFTFLVLGSTAVDYIVGLMLGRSKSPTSRRLWIATSVCVNLGVLVFFKYFNFFVSSASGFLAWLGLPASVNTLNIILPVGHQLLHVSLDELHDRRVPWKTAPHFEFCRSFVVRQFFPAIGGGADCACSVLSAAAGFGQEIFQCRCARRGDVIPGGIH